MGAPENLQITEDKKPAARGQVVYAEERFIDALPDLMALWRAHWLETEMHRHGEGFNPQIDRYQTYNEIGFYRLYTARIDGRMIGNLGMYVTESMYSGKKIATEDTLFVVPEFRKGRNALGLCRFVEEEMKRLGVREISMTMKLTNGAGRLLEYLGFRHIANQYTKSYQE